MCSLHSTDREAAALRYSLETGQSMRTTKSARAIAGALLVALVLAGCGGASGAGKSHSLAFTLTSQGCPPDQATVLSGPVRTAVRNGGPRVVTELELQDENEIIIGERENILPGLSSSFSLDL